MQRKLAGAGPFFRRGEVLIATLLTVLLLVTYPAVQNWDALQGVEGRALDWRFLLRGPETPTPEVVVVAIDDQTLETLGRWPFSRSYLARAVKAFKADGARAIVFDLLLVGAEMRSAVPATTDTGPQLPTRIPEIPPESADETLIGAISQAGNVVVPFAFVYNEKEANVSDVPHAVKKSAYRVVLETRSAALQPHSQPAGILAPLRPFVAAGQPAHITVFLEADGSLRYLHPAIQYGDAYYPALPVTAARLYFGLAHDAVSLEPGRGLEIGKRFIHTGTYSKAAIDYAGPTGSFKTIPLIDVLRNNFADGTFRDRIVLIGATAVGLGDRFVTPFSPQMPGVEVFANATAGLVSRGFLRRSTLTQGLDLIFIALCGVFSTICGAVRRPVASVISVGALLAIVSGINFYLFQSERMWLNLTFPVLTIFLIGGVTFIGRTLRENRLRGEAESQRDSLGRYVPPLARTHLEQRRKFGTVDGADTAIIMFVDLVGFTRATETRASQDTVARMRQFHRAIEAAAAKFGGTIDKYIGDAALVVFGLSSNTPSAAVSALACAREITVEFTERSGDLPEIEEPGPACGIGLHLGPVSIAEVGGDAHAQITVVGDTVNVASRLEELTRSLNASIIASDAVIEAARATGAEALLDDFEPLPIQKIRGRERELGLWVWRPRT